MDDTELLKRFVEADDEQAFRTLVERYTPMVYASARRQVRDPHLAEDVTQAVFITLVRKARSIRPENHLAGWLLATTRFHCKDTMKRDTRRTHYEHKVAVANSARQSDDSAATWLEISALVDDALSRLTEPERSAVALRYLQDKPLDDVAVTLGMTRDAAQKRIARAIERLRDSFSRRGITLAADAISIALANHALEPPPAGLAHAAANAALSAKVGTVAASLSAKTTMFVAVVLLITGGALWLAAAELRSGNAPATATAASISRNTAKVKVGFLIAGYIDTGPRNPPELYGWIGAQFAKTHMRDPAIEAYGLFQPADRDSIPPAVTQMFAPDHTLNAASVDDLRKVDVIFAAAEWNVEDDVSAAITKAVSQGTGFLHVGGVGNHFRLGSLVNYNNETNALNGMTADSDTTYFVSAQGENTCQIVNDHPLLAGLPKGPILVKSLNGAIGKLNGTPLIAAPNVKPKYGVMRESGASDDPDAVVFSPLYVSQLGKGRIVGCNWAQRVDPPEALNKAAKGSFYLRCIKWLANRPLE